MVSIINISNGIKEPTHGYQNCHISQTLIFGGMSRCENFCISELKFGSIRFYTILILQRYFHRYEGSCMILKTRKNCEIFIINTRMRSKRDDTNPALVYDITI